MVYEGKAHGMMADFDGVPDKFGGLRFKLRLSEELTNEVREEEGVWVPQSCTSWNSISALGT